MTEAEMKRLIEGVQTKSEQIRVLARAGVRNKDIAAFLGIGVQHVYNVLHRDRQNDARRAQTHSPLSLDSLPQRLAVGAGGVVQLPPQFVDQHGLAQGGEVFLQASGDELRILSRGAVLEYVRTVVQKQAPDAVPLLELALGLGPPAPS